MEAGADENNIERCFTAIERADACKWHRYAAVTPCEHQAPTAGSDHTAAVSYTIAAENTHDKHCRYCSVVTNEAHSWTGEEPNKTCDKCGKTFNSTEDEWTVTIYQADQTDTQLAYNAGYDGGTVYHVLKGASFTIPELPALWCNNQTAELVNL